MAYLELVRVGKTYPGAGGGYPALRDVNLSVNQGEFISLIGHSGCGKSTLLNLIAGLESPTAGTIRLDGRQVTGPGPDRGVVFQNYSLLPWLSLYDNVLVAVRAAVGPGAGARERAERFLRLVGLWEHRHKRPHQVSGGMKQRAAIARALAIEPAVLLLDEPFGALDALTRANLQEELLRLCSREGRRQTVVMVTHDIDEAIYLSDRVVVLTNGPAATIYEVVDVPLPRPRRKQGLLHLPGYTAVKERLLHLLTVELAGACA